MLIPSFVAKGAQLCASKARQSAQSPSERTGTQNVGAWSRTSSVGGVLADVKLAHALENR